MHRKFVPVLLCALCLFSSLLLLDSLQVPRRPFLTLVATEGIEEIEEANSILSATTTVKSIIASQRQSLPLRVLQFNILADGLSGLRKDFGAFSRLSKGGEEVSWEYRRRLLLQEMTQYDPDIITLQELDHYYDFMFQEMLARNYSCIYAPKPASACLEVSSRSDGCAVFIRKSKLRVVSAETITYAMSQENITACALNEDPPSVVTMRPQNQVAIIAVCEVVAAVASATSATVSVGRAPPMLIVATTHLKAAKNAFGELYRLAEADQLLSAIARVRRSLTAAENSCAAVLLTGDMNAKPESDGDSGSGTGTGSGDYPALTYSSIKSHALGLRSVYNDDKLVFDRDKLVVAEVNSVLINNSKNNKQNRGDMYGDDDDEYLASSPLYYDESSFRFYERTKVTPSTTATEGGGGKPTEKQSTNAGSSSYNELFRRRAIGLQTEGVYTTWKARVKRGVEKVSKHCIDYIFYTPQQQQQPQPQQGGGGDDRKGVLLPPSTPQSSPTSPAATTTTTTATLRAKAVLDVFTAEEVGASLLPSSTYPSDHLAIAADLLLEWTYQ